MNGTVSEFIESLFGKLKWPCTIAVLAAATFWYVLNPLGQAYINVPGSRLSFEIAGFERCSITFRSPLRITKWVVRLNQVPGNGSVSSGFLAGKSVSGGDIALLKIAAPKPPDGKAQSYLVDVFSTSSPTFEVQAISVDGHAMNLNDFFKSSLRSESEYIRLRYIRRPLANVIFRWNDPVSNIVLTLMFMGIVWLLFLMLQMEWSAYLRSDQSFRGYLDKKFGVGKVGFQDKEAYDKYVNHWAEWDTWYRFFQALGPALGFILTVSSLIQALNPVVLGANNLDAFLRGIHVAMVATFIGLLLRIVALESARVNDALLARADLLYEESQPVEEADLASFPEGRPL